MATLNTGARANTDTCANTGTHTDYEGHTILDTHDGSLFIFEFFEFYRIDTRKIKQFFVGGQIKQKMPLTSGIHPS